MINRKKVIVFFTSLLAILVALIFLNSNVMAVEAKQQTVYYLNSTGVIKGTLISSEDLLWPGRTIEKVFYIANDNNFECFIKNLVIEGELLNSDGRIIRKDDYRYNSFMSNSTISLYCDDKEVFRKNASDFIDMELKNNNIISIDKSSKRKFLLRVNMSEDTDNSTMNMSYKFNITTNFFSSGSAVMPEIPAEPIIEKVISGERLVQTGYLLDTKLLILAGLLVCCLGLSLFYKRKCSYWHKKD